MKSIFFLKKVQTSAAPDGLADAPRLSFDFCHGSHQTRGPFCAQNGLEGSVFHGFPRFLVGFPGFLVGFSWVFVLVGFALVFGWFCVGFALVLRWFCVGFPAFLVVFALVFALVFGWFCICFWLVLRWFCVGVALVLRGFLEQRPKPPCTCLVRGVSYRPSA